MLDFSWQQITAAINREPFLPGLIGRLALFAPRPQSSTIANIEVRGTRLALVPELPRGAPPTPAVTDRRSLVPFRVPHFPVRDTIYADSVQDVRGFGTLEPQSFPQAVLDCLRELGRELDLTLEFLRLGAVRGLITTAVDRMTGEPLKQLDLFAAFHVTPQEPQEWPIIGAGATGQETAAWAGQLTGLVNSIGRAMADEIPGGAYARIHGICGSAFFDAFTMHPEIRAAYFAIDNRPILESQLGASFTFRDVTLQEYRGKINGVPFVEPDMCYFFPAGVPDLFIEVYAPADYTDTVNTVAMPRYARQEQMEFDKGVKMEAQMNVLPICTLPRCLFAAQAVPWTAS